MVSILPVPRRPRSWLSSRAVSIICLLLGVGLSSCNAAAPRLRLSTGSETGYYYRLGQQLEDSASSVVKLDLTVEPSKGSLDNLERLRNRQADFALVQLDVAAKAMEAGDVQAIAVLAQEHCHLLVRRGQTQSLEQLGGKAIAIGTPGSGIRFTAEQILKAAQLPVRASDAGLEQAIQQLAQQQLDAVFYVGRLGASAQLRQGFADTANLDLLSLPPSLINFLTIQQPGTYQASTIPIGIYRVNPPIPSQPITTLATPTVLVTRPDVKPKTIRLLTWSILATARRYASFYPELQTGSPEILLRQGLFYTHPAAMQVYETGDPRQAWVRYWDSNSDLQAGVVLLLASSIFGLALQQWRRRRSQTIINRTLTRITELAQALKQDPQEALREIEELSQDNRLQFIAGNVPDEIYAQVQHKTQTFSDQCRSVLETQRRQLVLDTLLLLDDWQETLQTDPEAALQKLGQIKQQYREMLLSSQVDIQAYIELMELTLMSVMTLAPSRREQPSRPALAPVWVEPPICS